MALRAKEQSTAEAFLNLFNDEMLERRTAFPAEIRGINTNAAGSLLSVNVQPLIQQTISTENTDQLSFRNLPIITNVPVVFPHDTVSGFAITIPLQLGSQVLVVIADRSIDKWQQTGTISEPVETTTPRAHDLTDAIAIPGISNNKTQIANYELDKICMRNIDRTVYVCVDDAVEIESFGARIRVDNGDITVTGDNISLTAGGSSITMTTSEINISSPTVTINGIDFSNHVHLSNGNNKLTDPPV